MEVLKKIPLPLWIGFGLILVVIVFVSSKSQQPSNAQTTAGPVTSNTVGTPGMQSNAGTDQQLGNLSQITQGGVAQIIQNQQAMQNEIALLQSGNRTGLTQTASVPATGPTAQQLASGMNGVGMSAFGGSIQDSQNASAQNNAAVTSGAVPVSNFQG